MSVEEWDAFDVDDATLLALTESPLQYNLYQLRQCVPSVVGSLQRLFTQLILFSALQRLIWNQRETLGHGVSNIAVALLGLYLLADHAPVANAWLLYASYFAASFALIVACKRFSFAGHICALFTVCFMSATQYLMEDSTFTALRGALMIMAMKTISLGYDYSSTNDITWLDTASYVFNPATLLFGPFTSYAEFAKSRNVEKLDTHFFIQRILPAVGYALLSVACLVYSSCVTEVLPEHPEIFTDYRTAQSFRFSHYFICYLSLSSSLIGGFPADTAVTEWLQIEWPRSMSDVVVVWNLPMHRFLHKYVYAKTRAFGYFLAMLFTFIASSLLHGYNFQLTAILVSLGFCAYAESALRSKLAKRLNACIKSKACTAGCQHRFKKSHLRSYAVNLCFTALNIWHLIYLGMSFDGSGQESGYSWRHTLSTWSRWYFASHVVALMTLMVSFVL